MTSDLNVCPCGGDHELACGQFLADTHRLADESCDEAHRRSLERHMAECSACRREYSIERNIKSLVRRCCGAEGPAPEALRDRVHAAIQALVTVQHSETVVTDGRSIVRRTTTRVQVHRTDPPTG